MTLQEFRYILTLADLGSFALAAKECHVSQSTLSIQIRKLEEYLGVLIFERGGRRTVKPTAVGLKIIAQARIAIDAANAIRDLARNTDDPMAGDLKIGVIPSVGRFCMPHMVAAAALRYPKLRVHVQEDGTASLLRGLEREEIDAAVLSGSVNSDRLKVRPLFREPFVVALQDVHRLAAKDRVRESDLCDESLYSLEKRDNTREPHPVGCNGSILAGLSQTPVGNLEVLRDMIGGGRGCSILPALIAASFGDAGGGRNIVIRPFAPPVPFRTISMAWHTSSDREGTLFRWSEFARDHFHSAVELVRPCFQ